LKLEPGEWSRRMYLILSQDRDHAIFLFRWEIGMDQPLSESEYADVTPSQLQA
jgi:hypothetical protein